MASWSLPPGALNLGASGKVQPAVASRQQRTAAEVLNRLCVRPGVILADEVGMGKTFVAFAVAAGVVASTGGADGPVVIVVPSHMRTKWVDDWQKFLQHCVSDIDLKNRLKSRWAEVDDVAHLLRELGTAPERRRLVLFIKLTAFTSSVKDKWTKLALVQKAFSKNGHLSDSRRAFERWASHLLRMKGRGVDADLVGRLLDATPERWRSIINASDIGEPLTDDPVPELLSDRRQEGDLTAMYEFLRQLPSTPNRVGPDTVKRQSELFREAIAKTFRAVLEHTNWSTPLLILDEAHHLKNPGTTAHSLFSSEESSKEGVDYLRDCFDRMLFLTATPFQLGHYELMKVLGLFKAVRWDHPQAPVEGEVGVKETLQKLEDALDESQRLARRLEQRWGELRAEDVRADLVKAGLSASDAPEQLVKDWWRLVGSTGPSPLSQDIVAMVETTRAAKNHAQHLLAPWVIRHNRPRHFDEQQANGRCEPRRICRPGAAILSPGDPGSTETNPSEGIQLDDQTLLPFLLSIRAQAELAQGDGNARAYFAEGLASSYEAFHHTRARGAQALDGDREEGRSETPLPDLVASWYQQQIADIVPGKRIGDPLARQHPKINATVERAARLWERGEKVLIFCFYIQTARALRTHLSNKIELSMLRCAAQALGFPLPAQNDDEAAQQVRALLEKTSERCARDGALHNAIRTFVSGLVQERFGREPLGWLNDLEEAIHRFIRSYSFVARYFPLGHPAFREAVRGEGRVHPDAVAALETALAAPSDTGVTLAMRVQDFLDFMHEKWTDQGGGEEQEGSELQRYLAACKASKFVSIAHRTADENYEGGGGQRLLANVRVVTGDGMDPEAREVVMRAFNSPLFPEILVASQVLAEGVDLHRACHNVIHHDLCWNPSTLEQRIGRVDRIGSESERRRAPINIYEPFISATADEKMFRVVKDRERWFQVVMGGTFVLSEAETERRMQRLPLPDEIAESLAFDLAVVRG